MIMTGKQLKAFAARVPDDGQIEVEVPYLTYGHRWVPVHVSELRCSLDAMTVLGESLNEWERS